MQEHPSTGTMNDYSNIQQLIDRFFEGETTLEEEQKLYLFYADHPQLPDELEAYRDMMAGFGALPYTPSIPIEEPSEPIEEPSFIAPASHHRRRTFVIRMVSAIAAMLVLYIGYSALHNLQEEHDLARNYAGSYIIVGGQRIDDLSRIKPQIESALSQAKDIEQGLNETSTVKQAEQNVLDNVGNDEDRERIEKLLNE